MKSLVLLTGKGQAWSASYVYLSTNYTTNISFSFAKEKNNPGNYNNQKGAKIELGNSKVG